MNRSTHTFTQSGLGFAPFKVCPSTDPRAVRNTAFWCEHCGRQLKNRFFVSSADERVSVVGIDCLRKTGDAGLIQGAQRLLREQKAMELQLTRQLRQQERQTTERLLLNGETLQEVLDRLAQEIEEVRKKARDEIMDMDVTFAICTGASPFAGDMLRRACDLGEFSDSMVAVLEDIVAKKISGGARRKSSAFCLAATEAKIRVHELLDLVAKHRAAAQEIRDRIDAVYTSVKRGG